MNKFKFQYDNILSYINKKETMVKNKLSLQFNLLEKEEEKLENLRNKDTKYSELIHHNLNYGCSLREIKYINDYLRDLDNAIHETYINIKSINNKIDETKEELVNITKEKKIMEKLKASRFDEYKKGVKKQEEKIIDQFVSYTNSTNR